MKPYPQYFRRPARKLLACALLSCLAMATAPAAFAQSTAATIRGQVSVDSAPAPDAQVTATNVATGLSRSVQARSNGTYLVGGLPPGTYRIDVTANGQTTSKNITIAVGQTATLNLGVGGVTETATLGGATNLETVTVTASALTETKTSEVATYVTQKQIESLPQGSRNFLAFADTVPGMQFLTDGDGNTKLRSGAQTPSGINVFIDGVGQKSYVLPGGISGQDSSRGNPFPQSAIGEYKVITSNYKAEFDQLSSAAIVAATRSGTNEFEGDFFWDRTHTDWRSRSEFEEKPGATKAISKEEQYGVSFGGPIVRDVAHFFVAYEAKEYASPRSLQLGRGFAVDELPAPIQDEYGAGIFTAPFKQDLYFGKVDLALGDAHYLELSAKHREESETIQVGGQRLPSASTANINEDTRLDLRYQFTSGDWLNDAHVTYEKSFWSPQPTNFTPGYILSDGNWWDTIVQTGGGDNYQDKGQKGWSFQDDLTFTGWGGHTPKMGFKYKAITVDTLEQNKFNPQFYYDINESLTQPTHVNLGAPVGGYGDGTVSSRNKQFGIYIQDDWAVNDKLMLNLGVRWDYERTPSYEDHVTPAELVAALEASNTNHPNSSVNIDDYISTGSNRKAFKGAWAPRIGFSYDLNADQRHVIFGGAGRSYDRNLFDYLQNEISKASWGQYEFNFNSAMHPCSGNNCLTWDPRYLDPEVLRAQTAVSGRREFFMNNNDMNVPYSDQFSIGMRNAIGNWMTEVSVSHIRSHDGIAFQLGNRRDDGSFFPAPGFTDPPPWGQGFDTLASNLILANNVLETRANSLFLKIDKPYTHSSGWGTTLAYTYTDAEQNGPIDGWPGAFNAETIEGYGWFPSRVPEHRLVATGIYDAPWGLTLSAKLTLASATPRYMQDCNEVSSNYCHFDWYKPDDKFKQFDMAASKEWDTGSDVKFRVRADLLNVFNWANYSGYDDWRGWIYPDVNTNFGKPTAIALPTRTFKLSLGFSW